MAVDDSAIRRKLASAKAEAQDGGPGADRSWRVALARAARDELKLPLDVRALALGRAGLAEVLELPPERALIAVLEGPGEGLGVLTLAPEVLQAMVEVLTIGKVAAHAPSADRRPTRTDAAMVAPMLDAALIDLERALEQEADLVWAGGWRYASFLDDPRPLGLMLEDFSYRVLKADVELADGARKGLVQLILPAEGLGRLPTRGAATRAPSDEANAHRAFAEALAEEVGAAESTLIAVLMRLSVPLSGVMGLSVGDVLPLASASLDRISLEGVDGRKLAEGKLGQNRGMRALRLAATMSAAKTPVARTAPLPPLGGELPPLRQTG
jgi:flagellar motor switch protein FliM